MCFVSNVSVSSKIQVRSAVVRRARWLRLFALLLTLLGLAAQQRVLTPVVRPSDSVARLVAERIQSIETHAVRAEPALRVAAAPVFARVPPLSEGIVAWSRASVQPCLAPPCAERATASNTHFHSKRRIPRMNSDEPPRA